MAKGTGKSGPQRAEENVQSLIDFLDRYESKPLPREGERLNKSAIARECGFRREVLRDNPRCRDLLEQAYKRDNERFLNQLDQAELVREERSKIDKDRSNLESRILILLAEKAKLERDLERYKRRDNLMAETGKIT